MFERELRDLRHVPRWNILRRSRDQSVAEHMYFVAIYAIEIAEFIEWQGDRYALLRSALTHDIPEVWTGDIPGPAKHEVQNTDRMEHFENQMMAKVFPVHFAHFRCLGEARNILTVADRMDAVLFLADEFNMGNKSVGTLNNEATPFGSNYARLRKAIIRLPCADTIQGALLQEAHKAVHNGAEGVSRIFTDQTPP